MIVLADFGPHSGSIAGLLLLGVVSIEGSNTKLSANSSLGLLPTLRTDKKLIPGMCTGSSHSSVPSDTRVDTRGRGASSS